MKGNSDNLKLPKNPGNVTGKVDARYVRTSITFDGTGYQEYSPISHKESLEKSFREDFRSTGGYKTTEAHDKTQMSTSCEYEVRNYCIGGQSFSGESHLQNFYSGTFNTSAGGDIGTDTLAAIIQGSVGPKVEFHAAGTVSRMANKKSVAHAFVSASGDMQKDVEGSDFATTKGDKVTVTGENLINIVQKGDAAYHVQSGAMDTKVAKDLKMFSGTDLLIQSATKITLRVGTSSIVITPSNIEIIAQNSSGIIDLNPGGSGSGTGTPSETA